MAQETHRVLSADKGVQCGSSDWLRVQLLLGVPMVVLYVLGVPAALFVLLRRNAKKFDFVATKIVYSFLVLGYERFVTRASYAFLP